MTQTLERPDATTSTLEDIAPKCGLVLSVMGVQIKKCENTATWVGFTPCCGNSALICDEHYKARLVRPFRCGPCDKMHEDLIGWQHL